METIPKKPKLVVIVGPTASGKTDLALRVAEQFNGEIIAADSRTVYRGMDIGTAKPSKEEQKLIPHWGLDLVKPRENFNAHQFKQYAVSKIQDIQARGKLPIMVGGTGLYIDSVLFNFEFVDIESDSSREELEKLTTKQLQQIIKNHSYEMPENFQNHRHLIRSIERKGLKGNKTNKPALNTLIIGLMPSTDALKQRIAERVDKMFDDGFIEEVKELVDKYGEEAIVKSSGIGYKPAIEYIKGNLTQQESKELFKKGHWQYARRQRTWFKRNKFITWYESPKQAFAEITTILNN
jgi:tRNA dimethylallyltransferase